MDSTTIPLPSAFVANESELIKQGIPPDLAEEIYENGGFVIIQNLPKEKLQVGIDYRIFGAGEKFLGFKMIPPGLHIFTFKYKEAPTISLFLWIDLGDVIELKWDLQLEDLTDEMKRKNSSESAVANMLKTYDDRIACYPFPQYNEWKQIVSHVSKPVFEKLKPANPIGKISEQVNYKTKEAEQEELQGTSSGISVVDQEFRQRMRIKDEEGLPVFVYAPGGKVFFTDIPQPRADVKEIRTRLSRVLDKVSYKDLLGELQYAFAVFLIGHSYTGLEQWKRLIHLLSDCSKDLKTNPNLFMEFIVVLYFQMKLMEDDMFEDIFTGDNFLKVVLPMLFANIEDSDDVNPQLKKRSLQLRSFCEKKFGRSFDLPKS